MNIVKYVCLIGENILSLDTLGALNKMYCQKILSEKENTACLEQRQKRILVNRLISGRPETTKGS